jgi:hypothetical protein
VQEAGRGRDLLEKEATGPGTTSFNRGYWLRSNVQNLSNLVKFASQSGVVVCSVFTRDQRELASNWVYSLTRFGGIKEALLVTFDQGSLVECLTLGFVCFDGLTLLPPVRSDTIIGQETTEEVQYGGRYWFQVR